LIYLNNVSTQVKYHLLSFNIWVLASAANYSDAAWDIILARLQANPDLSSTIFGVDFTDDDFAAKMVALVNSRRKELAEQ
ncbi:hypothetical protein Tco_0391013, partial [Tanacetum coccineum]